MIPGLTIDEETERRIWAAFGDSPDWYKNRLAECGVTGLLDDYRDLVESVETESCKHTSDGTKRTGEDWRYCCGISYEYWNDLAVRDTLEQIIRLVPPSAITEIEAEVAALDERLYRMTDDPPPREGSWWQKKLPRTICE